MKKIMAFAIAVLTVFTVAANDFKVLADDDSRQSVYGALDNAVQSMKQAPFGKNPIAILPLKKGGELLTGRLKNMLVNAGFVCVEGKDDPMWDEILKEIAWAERKDDILDAETIVKFGKLKSAKILLQCDIRIVSKSAERIYSEIELRATDIATKQIIWGGTFSHRYYIGKNVIGFIDLDDDSRMILKKNFDEAKKSLTAPQTAAKLDHLKTITVVPISGDYDSYATNMAIAMLSQTKLTPRNHHIPSLTQIRSAARDGVLPSDAVFYGSLRALHKTAPTPKQVGKKITTSYEVISEIQLTIEDAKNGNILWSDTIYVSEVISSERDMTGEELKEYRDKKIDNIENDIKEDVADNWKSYLMVIGIIIGSIILLWLIIVAIKAFVSYNNVR